MRRALHIAAVIAALFLLLGVPCLGSPAFKALISGDTDAVSGATVALDQPSGEYVVFINTSLHTDETALTAWQEFFETGESDDIYNVFEDISCTVASNDPGGLEMARSFMSRLPENQMKVRTEDVTLMLSKAESGRFDVIVMSKELAEACSAERIPDKTQAELIYVKGETA